MAAAGFENLSYELDPVSKLRAAIGLVALADDSTIEHEFRLLLNVPGVDYYISRILTPTEMSLEALSDMEGGITGAVELLVPGQRLDVVAFGCTAAPMMFGEEAVVKRIQTARPSVLCTTPIAAAITAFKTLGVRRIGVITPYPQDLNSLLYDFIVDQGLEIVKFASFDEKDTTCAGRIDMASINEGAIYVGDAPDVEAVFVSCTSLRVCEFVEELERKLGKPVTSSNHALAWHCLRLAGIDDKIPRFGRLFCESLS